MPLQCAPMPLQHRPNIAPMPLFRCATIWPPLSRYISRFTSTVTEIFALITHQKCHNNHSHVNAVKPNDNQNSNRTDLQRHTGDGVEPEVEDMTNHIGGVQDVEDMTNHTGGVQDVEDMADHTGGVQDVEDMADHTGGVQNVEDMTNHTGGVQDVEDMADHTGGVQDVEDMAVHTGCVLNVYSWCTRCKKM